MADRNDTCTCLRHFVQEKSASCGVDKLFIFVFISVKSYFSPILSTMLANNFSVKIKCLGHNPPPLNHGFGVTLTCTSFPVPADTIFVV